ncbi:hypothetical protein VTI74DRAFT_9396 [Chaetomium olivicolor]
MSPSDGVSVHFSVLCTLYEPQPHCGMDGSSVECEKGGRLDGTWLRGKSQTQIPCSLWLVADGAEWMVPFVGGQAEHVGVWDGKKMERERRRGLQGLLKVKPLSLRPFASSSVGLFWYVTPWHDCTDQSEPASACGRLCASCAVEGGLGYIRGWG